MTESTVYNVVGLLIIAAALIEAWYFWPIPNQWQSSGMHWIFLEGRRGRQICLPDLRGRGP
jgi:hypothetical protein